MISEGSEASAAEPGEHFGQSGLFPASAESWTRGGGGGGLRARGGVGSRGSWSAGRGAALPGWGGAAGLCLAAEAEQVSVAGSFAPVDSSSLLLVQFLLEEQGQSAVLLLLLGPAQLVLLRQRRRGAGMKTRSFGRRHHSVV